MCFSAIASFTAGAALVAVGTVTVNRSQGRRELPIALVPLLFGVQQISKGVLWLTMTRDLPGVQVWATNVYSFSSHAFWPIFVPFAILMVETHRRRRQALKVFLGVGVLVGLYLCINVFGVLAFVLAVAAYLIAVRTFVSVWCFFAAVLSGLILLHFSGSMLASRQARDQYA